MIAMTRIVSLALAWLVLALGLGSALPSLRLLLDGSTGLLVAVLPLAAVSIARSPAAVFGALAMALRDDRSLDAQSREEGARILRSLGRAALGTGLILALLTLVGTFNAVALNAGKARSLETFVAMGGMALGPVYGLVAKGFLYDPLASGLEENGGALGAQL